MKNVLKKLFICVGVSLMLIGCGVYKKQQTPDTETLGVSMRVTCNIQNGKEYQIDSLVNADALPMLNKWLSSVYVDYETNKKILKRMYVRTYEDGTEAVYVITGEKEPYKIQKRITE